MGAPFCYTHPTRMKHQFVAGFIAFSVILTPAAAFAATAVPAPTERYFVQTTKSFWRNAFRARHVFDGGFTADLSGFQLQLARFAGLKLLPVRTFSILAEASPTPQPTPTQQVSWGVQAVLQGAEAGFGGAGVTIAVLDTGIDREHPDLRARIGGCFDLTDPLKGFLEDRCDDANGHGTHEAGIIAADGGAEGSGVFGIVPESNLLIYRVCNDEGTCRSDDIAVGIRSAVDKKANIIVLGLGGELASSFIDDAIKYADAHGALVVVAAGNDGPYDDSVDFPARNPLAVSVGALAPDGTLADFSSRGGVDLLAPGVDIESTTINKSYAVLSGTSMAASHVAGLAALLWQADAEDPAQATRDLLKDTLVY